MSDDDAVPKSKHEIVNRYVEGSIAYVNLSDSGSLSSDEEDELLDKLDAVWESMTPKQIYEAQDILATIIPGE